MYVCMYQVINAENELKKWNTIIKQLYIKYDELAFFSVAKIISLCDILKKNSSGDKVVQEIGFLFRNEDSVMQMLKEAVEVLYACTYF